VVDDIPPEITCPPDVVLEPEPGECGVTSGSPALGTATATDNCDPHPIVWSDPDFFPIGETIVKWVAEDFCGNEDRCFQVVKVGFWLDIKPTSCPNPLNYGFGGANVPMAILGCEGFDVRNIDVSSILVEGTIEPLKWGYEDVTRPIDERDDPCDCTTEGPDGYTDLTFKVSREELIIVLEAKYGELENGDIVEVTVTADYCPGTSVTEGGNCLTLSGRDCMIIRGVNSVAGPMSHKSKAGLSLPKIFGLGQNKPNPLPGNTTILYQIPKTTDVTLSVYDATGRLVRLLVGEKMKPGYYSVVWDATDGRKRPVANGVYFYTMKAGDFSATRQMILMRK
jgi:hypothetical protein